MTVTSNFSPMLTELNLTDHHRRAIERMLCRYHDDAGVVGVIVAGSIARGRAKPSSDIDVMLIVGAERYANLRESHRLSECIHDLCDYEGGYVDIKYFSRDYLTAAVEHASEPTRASFVGARVLFDRDDAGLQAIADRISEYPEHEREEKLKSFHAGLSLNHVYFWHESQKRNLAYLQSRVVADIAYFGVRLVLAHNRVLFPCHKWMVNALADAVEKPDGMEASLMAFLNEPTSESMNAFAQPILKFRKWTDSPWSGVLTRYIEDHEQWWHHPRPNIFEW